MATHLAIDDTPIELGAKGIEQFLSRICPSPAGIVQWQDLSFPYSR